MDNVLNNPAHPGSSSPRLRLWTELETLHNQVGLPAPTDTLTVEELQDEVERLRQQVMNMPYDIRRNQ